MHSPLTPADISDLRLPTAQRNQACPVQPRHQAPKGTSLRRRDRNLSAPIRVAQDAAATRQGAVTGRLDPQHLSLVATRIHPMATLQP